MKAHGEVLSLGSSTGASGSRCYDSKEKPCRARGFPAVWRLGSSTGASGSRYGSMAGCHMLVNLSHALALTRSRTFILGYVRRLLGDDCSSSRACGAERKE